MLRELRIAFNYKPDLGNALLADVQIFVNHNAYYVSATCPFRSGGRSGLRLNTTVGFKKNKKK
jgi:hypothetical protein